MTSRQGWEGQGGHATPDFEGDHSLDLPSTNGKPRDGGKKRPTQADLLAQLAFAQIDLFHGPGDDADGFATLQANGHQETWALGSKGFKRWLARLFFEETGKAPGSQALQDTLAVLQGHARFVGPEISIAVRLAQQDNAIWLDLADSEWRAVRISDTGWSIASNPSVKFIRRRGMLALPIPERGGSLTALRPLVNLPDDNAWILFVSWLVAALRPGRPFPILAVNGEQGTAKTSLCRVARSLIDPNAANLRRPPRDDRDLMVAATNSWVVAFDNLSGLRPDLSDSLCTLATGGGFGTRELYSDAEEKLFDATRPIIVNGIEDVVVRPDVLDRAIALSLEPIPDASRLTEDNLWTRFQAIHPRILGALCDAVSMALRNLSAVNLESKPRMADFAEWVAAAEPALPWPKGSFLAAYLRNRGTANVAAVEGSIIGQPIIYLVQARERWEGTVGELLAELENNYSDDRLRRAQEWPKTSRKLAGQLRRIGPNLRRLGIMVTFGEHTKQGRKLVLEKSGETSSPPSPPSPISNLCGQTGDDW